MSQSRYVSASAVAAATVAALCLSLLHLSAQPPIPGVNLRVIVVASTAEANRAIARVKAGEAFQSVARAMSIDGSAAEGGLLGKVELISLRADIRQALQGLGAGQVVGPLQI